MIATEASLILTHTVSNIARKGHVNTVLGPTIGGGEGSREGLDPEVEISPVSVELLAGGKGGIPQNPDKNSLFHCCS